MRKLTLISWLSTLIVVSSDCTADDIIVKAGESLGHTGLECFNGNSFHGLESICRIDGMFMEMEKDFTCPPTAPHCVQCGPPGWGAAACLGSDDPYCCTHLCDI